MRRNSIRPSASTAYTSWKSQARYLIVKFDLEFYEAKVDSVFGFLNNHLMKPRAYNLIVKRNRVLSQSAPMLSLWLFSKTTNYTSSFYIAVELNNKKAEEYSTSLVIISKKLLFSTYFS